MILDTHSHVPPRFVDLRPATDHIEDQGRIGSCVSNALHTLFAILAERKGWSLEFSRMWMHYALRYMRARIGQDGAYPRDAWEVMMTRGCCLESTWPYDLSKVNEMPPFSADIEAQLWTIGAYADLMAAPEPKIGYDTPANILNKYRHAAAQGRPAAVSLTLTQDFIDQGRLHHAWRDFEWDSTPSDSNPIVGGHAVVAIGYDDDAGRVLCQNSWTKEWGDGGFFGIPYELLGNHALGVNSMYCSMLDGIGNVPVADYLPKVWNPQTDAAIDQQLQLHILPLRNLIIKHNVDPFQVDLRAGWTPGRAKEIFALP